MNEKNVLIVCRMLSDFNELFRIAILLKNDSKLVPVIYFDSNDYVAFESVKAKCNSLGIKILSYTINSSNNPHSQNDTISSKKRFLLEQIKKRYPKVLLFFYRFIIEYLKSIVETRKIKSIAQGLNVELLIVGEDGIGSNLYITKFFKKRKKRIIIIPYEFSGIKQLHQYVIKHDELKVTGSINRLIGKRYPKWIQCIDGQKYFVELPSKILFWELTNIAPLNPWAVHGGSADFLAAESNMMVNHYLNCDIDPTKVILTGSTSDDELFQNTSNVAFNKEKLSEIFNFNNNLKIILCSLPPDYTQYAVKCEFSNYEDLLLFWAKSFSSFDINLVFQFHPRTPRKYVDFLKEQGYNVTDDNIVNLIPSCDIFVTSVSSVIRMAIACGKPVINYDIYNFDYDDYKNIDAVIEVKSKADYKAKLNELLTDDVFLESLISKQIRISKDWGLLDGFSSQRILSLIYKCGNKY